MANSAFRRFNSKTSFFSTSPEPKKLDWSQEKALDKEKIRIRKTKEKKQAQNQEEREESIYLKQLSK
jgi:hypothetical protein